MAQETERTPASAATGLDAVACAAACAALDCVPVGMVLVDARHNVVSYNATAADIAAQRDGVRIMRRTLQLTNDHDDQMLAEAIDAAAKAGARGRRRATRVLGATRPSGRRSFTIVVTPLAGDSPDEAVVGVFIGDPEVEIVPPVPVLQEMFGLTPAEAKLASLLAAGLRIDDAARQLGISVHTARAQLKQVFAKTGTHRQAALMRVLLTSPAGLRIEKAGQSLRRSP